VWFLHCWNKDSVVMGFCVVDVRICKVLSLRLKQCLLIPYVEHDW